jgi:hypothetical protein
VISQLKPGDANTSRQWLGIEAMLTTMSVIITTPWDVDPGPMFNLGSPSERTYGAREFRSLPFQRQGSRGPELRHLPNIPPPGANPFPALKTGCRMRTPSHRKKLETLKDTKGHNNVCAISTSLSMKVFHSRKLWPTESSISSRKHTQEADNRPRHG